MTDLFRMLDKLDDDEVDEAWRHAMDNHYHRISSVDLDDWRDEVVPWTFTTVINFSDFASEIQQYLEERE